MLVTPLASGAGDLVVLTRYSGQAVDVIKLDDALPALVDVVQDLRGAGSSMLWISVRPDGRFEFITPAGAGPRRHLVPPLLTPSEPGSFDALREYAPAEADLLISHLQAQAFR